MLYNNVQHTAFFKDDGGMWRTEEGKFFLEWSVSQRPAMSPVKYAGQTAAMCSTCKPYIER
jgi:hypothetical protein